MSSRSLATHAIVELRSNGERSRAERGWTVICRCGWEEYVSSREVARQEFRGHKRMRAEEAKGKARGEGA